MKLFYLSRARFLGIKNSIRRGDRRSGAVWGLLVLAVLVALDSLFAGVLRKVNDLPLVGYALNHHIMVMFLFSLFGMLVFSNVVTALGTFYTSSELPLIFASPLPYRSVFFSKFAETCSTSSWMVLLIISPYLWAYGRLYHARPSFYVTYWVPLVPFFMAATCLGLLVTFLIARILPVGQTRNLLRFLMVFAGALLLLIFRVMRPEQLVDPDRINMLIQMIEQSWNPRLQYSPAGYTVRAISHAMGHTSAVWDGDLAVIALATTLLVGLTWLVATRVHGPTWLAYQESTGSGLSELSLDEALTRLDLPAHVTPGSLIETIAGWRAERLPPRELRRRLEELFSFMRPRDRRVPVERVLGELAVDGEGRFARLLAFLELPMRAIVTKDLKTFSRSPVLWTQMMLMLLIMFIYLYNIHLLPISTLTVADRMLAEALAFLNIGFVALITIALALRFGFPAISMEGRGFFMVHSSPVGVHSYVRIKFWSNLLPLLLISEVLVGISGWLLGATGLVLGLAFVDTLAMTVAIGALAIYFGILYVNFSAESFSRIPSGIGGMVFMMTSMIFVAVALGFQVHPYWLLFQAHAHWGRSVNEEMALAYLGAMVVASTTLACLVTWFSLRAGTRRLAFLEEGAHVDPD